MIKLGLKTSLAAVSAALLLVACGGDTNVTGVQPVTFVAAGTVATGVAAADGTVVTVTCASGSATGAISGGVGKYSVTVTGGVAPCVITATVGGVTMKSITQAATPGANTTVVANLNPLTTAVVDALLALKTNGTSTDVTQLVKSASATPTQAEINAVATNTVTAVRAAQTAANGGSAPANILPATVNLLTDTLDAAPANGSNPGGGNAYDDALDALKAAAIVSSTGVLKTSVVDTIKTTSDSAVNPTPTTGGQ